MNKMFPKKHISLEQSLLGFGAKILTIVKDGSTIENLWQKCNTDSIVKHSFDDLLLTLDYLYIIDAITIDKEGNICLN